MRTALIAGGVGLVALVLVALQGCGKPPQIGPDEETFREVDALFTAVTARRPEMVDECARRLQTQRDGGKLPAKAHDELRKVIDRAKDGRWEAAAERLYAFMQGQERPVVEGHRERKTDPAKRARR